jgi:hypothetical protein
VAAPSQPALGLYGSGICPSQYPDYVNHDPDADYDDDFIWFHEPLAMAGERQCTLVYSWILGLTRKNGLSANGYGRMATSYVRALMYIIIIDIISNGEKANPFPL